MKKDKILLFIPMYNCEKQIVRVLNQLDQAICSYFSEVIIVNNCSTDDGELAVKKYLETNPLTVKVCILRNDDNYGLGGSHKVAFQYAVKHGYDYIIVLHGDDQGSVSNIIPYLKSQKYKKYNCLLGARFMKRSRLQGYSGFRTFGNHIYNLLFTLGTGKKIYDLGSGLNMYEVDILKNKFYLKYKDNLMFNYCMILGSVYYGHKIHFFPMLWREDDQISNVKMLSQAIIVLQLLASYILNKRKFVFAEHRDKVIDQYHAQTIYVSKIAGKE